MSANFGTAASAARTAGSAYSIIRGAAIEVVRRVGHGVVVLLKIYAH
jgi:hypothetical protein